MRAIVKKSGCNDVSVAKDRDEVRASRSGYESVVEVADAALHLFVVKVSLIRCC